MSEKEIQEEAKEIILQVCESVEKTSESERFVLTKTADGELVFVIKFDEGCLGKGTVFYSPQPFIENLIRLREEELQVAKNTSLATLELVRLYWEMKISETANILINIIQGEFKMAIAQQGVLALSIFCEGTKEILASQDVLATTKAALEDVLKQQEEVRKFFVKNLNQRHTAPQIIFCHIYKTQLKLWNEVKDCYKQNKKYKNCLAMVKAQFPNLPNELVEKLADDALDPYDSMPSSLALRATAMITNAPKKLSSIRSLYDYLEGSKKLQETVSKEEIRDALLNYMAYISQKYDEVDLIKSLLTDTETLSDTTH